MKRPGGFLTVEQAARALKISPARVRVLLAKGHLAGFLLAEGGRELWQVHASLYRRPAKAGRPKKRRAEGEARKPQ